MLEGQAWSLWTQLVYYQQLINNKCENSAVNIGSAAKPRRYKRLSGCRQFSHGRDFWAAYIDGNIDKICAGQDVLVPTGSGLITAEKAKEQKGIQVASTTPKCMQRTAANTRAIQYVV